METAKWGRRLFAIPLACALLTGCGKAAAPSVDAGAEVKIDAAAPKIALRSPAFQEGGAIPARYTCGGQDVSPPLFWSGVPAKAAALVLIVEDPDAPSGTFTHWILFNIPKSQTSLPENIPPLAKLPNGALQGTNDFNQIGYGGPCPPSGTHRYIFKLMAVDQTLKAAVGANKQQVIAALNGHVLALGQLMGTYAK